MRRKLELRIARLEAVRPKVPSLIIVVHFIGPDGNCQSDRAEAYGRLWQRRPGETPEEFERRVIAAKPKQGGSSEIILFEEEDTEDKYSAGRRSQSLRSSRG